MVAPKARTASSKVAEAPARRRRSPAEVRQLLLDSAVEMFAAHGFGGTNAKEIAEAAGVSESTVYRHFDSKSALFVEAAINPLEGFLAELSDWVVEQFDLVAGQDFMHILTEYLFEQMRARRGIMLALLSSSQHPEMAAQIAQIRTRLEDGIFKPLHMIGMYRAKQRNLDVDPEKMRMTSRLVVTLVTSTSIFSDWILPNGPRQPGPERILDELVDFILYGATSHRDAIRDLLETLEPADTSALDSTRSLEIRGTQTA